MIKLKDYTLKTLIDDQDCAVEAVKLEWLLKNDLNERKKQRYRGSSPNAHDGTWEKPCYAKSRCVRLLLCNECSTETPKPRKIEESVLDEVTTV